MSEILFDKNMLLQSLTMLFEGVLAYLDEKTNPKFECKKGMEKYTKKSNKYKFRNCLKSAIYKIKYKSIPYIIKKNILIPNIDEFAKHLVKVDKLRNISAHAFIDTKKANLFKEDIKKEIYYFKEKIK